MNGRNALTLIEVVAALALLATTVTLLLTAQARSLEQLRATRDQEQAAVLAGELIARWRLEPPGTAVPAEGAFQDPPGWHWTRRASPSALADPGLLDLDEVTLTVYRREQTGSDSVLMAYTWLEMRP